MSFTVVGHAWRWLSNSNERDTMTVYQMFEEADTICYKATNTEKNYPALFRKT